MPDVPSSVSARKKLAPWRQLLPKITEKARMRLLRLLAPAVLLLGASSSASAQRWTFVPVIIGEAEAPSPAALERATEAAQLPLLPNSQAAASLEAEHSSDGELLGPEEVERLDKLIGAGARELARSEEHRRGGARVREDVDLLKQIESKPAAVLDYLRRSPERAQLLIDACVTASWLSYKDKTQGPKPAKQQLQRCIHTFPGLRPRSAPSPITALFDEVLQEVADEPHGRLEVSSGREGCLVRFNGTALGPAPVSVEVPLGPARVQVECDEQPGRIHAVSVAPGKTRVSIDPQLEKVIRTADRQLKLVFRSGAPAPTTAQLARTGELLGQLVHARVVLVVPAAPSGAAIRVLVTPSKDLGTFPSLTAAQKRVLTELRSSTPPPPPPNPEPSQPSPSLIAAERADVSHAPPPRARAEREPLWPTIAAGTGIAIGVGGVAVSWVYYFRRLSLRSGWDTVSFDDIAQFRAAGTLSIGFGLGANVFLAAAEYVVLPHGQGIPLLAWAAAGGGAILAGFGAISVYTQRDCSLPSTVCTGFANDPLFGGLLMVHALPLLTVPLNYWLRETLNAPVRVELGLGNQSEPLLQVHGAF